jgi:phosphate transport system protein
MKNSMNDVAVSSDKTFLTEKYLYASDKERLVKLVQKMAEEALMSVVVAVESLNEADGSKARSVIERDDVIDEIEEKIDQECLYSIAMRQPMREDLRFVYAVTKIITDLERIGDQGENIAKCSLNLLKTDGINESLYYTEKPASEEILSMCSQIEIMFENLILAFINEDESAAQEILKLNSIFHETGDKAVNSLVIFASRNNLPEVLDIFKNMLWIVRHLDRIGDHIMNIAERICFIVTGITSESLKKKSKKTSTSE